MSALSDTVMLWSIIWEPPVRIEGMCLSSFLPLTAVCTWTLWTHIIIISVLFVCLSWLHFFSVPPSLQPYFLHFFIGLFSNELPTCESESVFQEAILLQYTTCWFQKKNFRELVLLYKRIIEDFIPGIIYQILARITRLM
jgi:hypothetical protein